ncbi:MSHA biogenesis protein MshG [Alishewanella longhuensis]
MPAFQYQARDGNGRAVNGQLEALSAPAAAALLRERGLIVLQLQQAAELSSSKKVSFFSKKVGLEELIIFSRQMYSLIKAGIPIIRAIGSLREDALRHWAQY